MIERCIELMGDMDRARKYFKDIARMVHPDKNSHPLASEVFPNGDVQLQRYFARDWFYAFAKCDFDHAPYFLGRDKIFVGGASASAGTFILFWTLFYNICHLF